MRPRSRFYAKLGSRASTLAVNINSRRSGAEGKLCYILQDITCRTAHAPQRASQMHLKDAHRLYPELTGAPPACRDALCVSREACRLPGRHRGGHRHPLTASTSGSVTDHTPSAKRLRKYGRRQNSEYRAWRRHVGLKREYSAPETPRNGSRGRPRYSRTWKTPKSRRSPFHPVLRHPAVSSVRPGRSPGNKAASALSHYFPAGSWTTTSASARLMYLHPHRGTAAGGRRRACPGTGISSCTPRSV